MHTLLFTKVFRYSRCLQLTKIYLCIFTIPFLFSLPYGQPLVYKPNPYVYIPAIGQVAKPELEAKVKTTDITAIKPLVYATHPYVYTHPVHISPIVPRGFAYSFTVDHDDTKSA